MIFYYSREQRLQDPVWIWTYDISDASSAQLDLGCHNQHSDGTYPFLSNSRYCRSVMPIQHIGAVLLALRGRMRKQNIIRIKSSETKGSHCLFVVGFAKLIANSFLASHLTPATTDA